MRGIIYVYNIIYHALAHEDCKPSRTLPTPKVGGLEEKNQLQVTFQALGMGILMINLWKAIDCKFNASKCLYLFGKYCYTQAHLRQPKGKKALGQIQKVYFILASSECMSM